jgi:hypothetical protein
LISSLGVSFLQEINRTTNRNILCNALGFLWNNEEIMSLLLFIKQKKSQLSLGFKLYQAIILISF